MSWTGNLFSDNEGKRREIERSTGKLYALLDNCFLATNKLTDCIQKYLPGRQFINVERDASKSIPCDCNLIIERLDELEMYLQNKKRDLEKEMSPENFKKLVSTDTSDMEKIQIAKSAPTTIIDIAGSMEGILLCGAINAGNVFANFTSSLCVLKTSVAPSIASGFLDDVRVMFMYAVTKATGWYQPKDELNDYHRLVQEFEAVCDEFYDHISFVLAMIKLSAFPSSDILPQGANHMF